MRLPSVLSAACILAVLACILLAGCMEDPHYPDRDIHVYRTDSAGNEVWHQTFASNRDESVDALVVTRDGGFAIAGLVADKHGAPAYPRLIQLDGDGKVLGDTVIDTTDCYAVSLAETDDGGFFVGENINNRDKGRVFRIGPDGTWQWNRLYDSPVTGVTALPGNRFALAGGRTRVLDGEGTLILDLPDGSTRIIGTSDGGYMAVAWGPEYYGNPVFRLDANGTVLWNRPLGQVMGGTLALFEENPDGTITIGTTFTDMSRAGSTVMDMKTWVLTRAVNGTLLEDRAISAVDPLARTAGGGYTFLGYENSESGGYTTQANGDGKLHLVHLSPENTVLRDRSFDLGIWTAPIAVRELPVGGYILVILTGK